MIALRSLPLMGCVYAEKHFSPQKELFLDMKKTLNKFFFRND